MLNLFLIGSWNHSCKAARKLEDKKTTSSVEHRGLVTASFKRPQGGSAIPALEPETERFATLCRWALFKSVLFGVERALSVVERRPHL